MYKEIFKELEEQSGYIFGDELYKQVDELAYRLLEALKGIATKEEIKDMNTVPLAEQPEAKTAVFYWAVKEMAATMKIDLGALIAAILTENNKELQQHLK